MKRLRSYHVLGSGLVPRLGIRTGKQRGTRVRAECNYKIGIESDIGEGKQQFLLDPTRLLLHFPFYVLFQHTEKPRRSVPEDSICL